MSKDTNAGVIHSSINLMGDDYDWLRKESARYGGSKSAIIRRALREYRMRRSQPA
jgi:hypothetical protein